MLDSLTVLGSGAMALCRPFAAYAAYARAVLDFMASAASSDPVEWLKLYAACPPFRSAEGSELIFDNPFRRPVRSDDLRFIDYSRPLARDNALQLSGLASHRMLLNIYENDYLFLSGPQNEAVDRDFRAFYADRNRVLGEVVRPFLEHHVFSFLDGQESAPTESIVIADEFQRAGREVIESGSRLLQAIQDSKDRDRAARMLVIQLVGPQLSRELAIARMGMVVDLLPAGAIAEPFATLLDVGRGTKTAETVAALRHLAESIGLLSHPHAYWQFYLTSWIATANYFHAVTRDHGRFPQGIAALFLDRLRLAALTPLFVDVLQASLATRPMCTYFDQWRVAAPAKLEASFARLVDILTMARGASVTAPMTKGLRDAASLYTLADDDLLTQLAWADRPADNVEKARRLFEFIRNSDVKVDLETYVESCSERSTTHVHDTDRLLVIGRGEMDFWHSFGPPLRFAAGDLIFVPKHRLHGSVVVTPECVYHQPIITAEIAGVAA
jgi:hypothetical protein